MQMSLVIKSGKATKRIDLQWEVIELLRHRKKKICVLYSKVMSPDKHIAQITGETYKVLLNIRVVLDYMEEDMTGKTTVLKI